MFTEDTNLNMTQYQDEFRNLSGCVIKILMLQISIARCQIEPEIHIFPAMYGKGESRCGQNWSNQGFRQCNEVDDSNLEIGLTLCGGLSRTRQPHPFPSSHLSILWSWIILGHIHVLPQLIIDMFELIAMQFNDVHLHYDVLAPKWWRLAPSPSTVADGGGDGLEPPIQVSRSFPQWNSGWCRSRTLPDLLSGSNYQIFTALVNFRKQDTTISKTVSRILKIDIWFDIFPQNLILMLR